MLGRGVRAHDRGRSASHRRQKNGPETHQESSDQSRPTGCHPWVSRVPAMSLFGLGNRSDKVSQGEGINLSVLPARPMFP
jgi:hypothetical protein